MKLPVMKKVDKARFGVIRGGLLYSGVEKCACLFQEKDFIPPK